MKKLIETEPISNKKKRLSLSIKITVIVLILTLVYLYGLLDYTTWITFRINESISESSSRDKFIAWTKFHGKSYQNFVEFEQKYETFIENSDRVKKLNEIYKGKTEFALNQFADMTPSEFKSKILISNMEHKRFVTSDQKVLKPLNNIKSLPDKFDWRSLNAVTPVKDQGQVGTCWAFSATENLEGLYALKTKNLINLSVEQIVDCDGKFIRVNESNCGVYGGWPYLAFEYVKFAGGIESEDDYGYCSGSGKCLPCSPPGYNRTECGPPVPFCRLSDSCQAKLDPSKFVADLKVKDWMRTSQNETDIAAQLMVNGPFSVALNAELLQFYFGGIFDPFDKICNRDALNHAVLLVGFGIDHSIIFGQRPYWIVKNSWGRGWGEQGYFRILRGKNKCGIVDQVTTAVLE